MGIMFVFRYMGRAAVLFACGFVAFFLILLAAVAGLLLLGLGFTSAVFFIWAIANVVFYLFTHDHAHLHSAGYAIFYAAGAFAVIALISGATTDLIMWAKRPRQLTLELRNRVAGKSVSPSLVPSV
jgi:hypothetical protein